MEQVNNDGDRIMKAWVDVERVGPPLGTMPHVAMLFPMIESRSRPDDVNYEVGFGRYSSGKNQFQIWTGEDHQVAFPRYYQELK